jgi:protein-S-isoprenylcysteine O-methyltransferase Ste14
MMMETQSNMVFRAIFFALFFAVLVIRGYHGWKQRRAGQSSGAVTKGAVEREGMWSIIFRFILFLYMVTVAIVFAINPPWLNLFAAHFATWSRWMGMGLGVLSLPLLIWVHHTLGRHWSTNLRLRQNHALITEGPYRWVRHPMYTALFSFFVGLALISASWLIVILVVAAILVLYARIGKEETMMSEQFGDEYCAYMQRTGRLLPRL